MHKVKEHIEKAECLQDKILQCLQSLDLNCDGGKETFYYMVDCSKDLAEVMEKEAKAAYYKHIAEEMKEEKECLLKMDVSTMEIARMGYDNWRYSSGRYAPTGKGHYTGHRSSGYTTPYTPDGTPIIGSDKVFGEMTEVYDPTRMNMMPMGYGDGRIHEGGMPSQYGQNYDNYRMSKRHYTETKDEKDKQAMQDSAKRHVTDIEHTMKDIWKDADPALRRDMKASMQSLLNEMTV